LAAASIGAAAEAGRGDGKGAFATAGRGGDGGVAAPGSGVIMLTGGVEAAVGKSALVGLPISVDGGSAATGAAAAGAFHDGA
jgi:hypothetical protein